MPLDLIAELRRDPRGLARLAAQVLAERNLIDFIRVMWPVLEPGRPFVDGWAVHAVCEHLEAVSRGEIRKLLINVPPGCMKSLTTNVFWPAWEWGPLGRPSLRYISASYSEALTVRDNRRCRQLMESDLYRSMWGKRFDFSGDQNAKIRYDNSHTGFRIATSVGGLATGERGDRLICDDPHNVKDAESELVRESTLQWFTEVWSTRTNDDTAAFVVIMQRVHERDVSGLILAQQLGFEHLMLPMEFEPERRCSTSIGFVDPRRLRGQLLWPERFSQEHLDGHLKPSLRAWGGSYAEAGQLQQRPAPRGGGMFKAKDFGYVDSPPRAARRVRGWDLAGTKDAGAYTVGARLSLAPDGRLYIEDVVRAQAGPGEAQELITSTAARDGRGVEISLPQDPGQAGKFQVQYLARQLHGWPVYYSPETGTKEDRARPLAAQAECGNVFLVRGHWNDAFIAEATMFPTGHFKDQIDACSRSYSRLLTAAPRTVGAAPEAVSG